MHSTKHQLPPLSGEPSKNPTTRAVRPSAVTVSLGRIVVALILALSASAATVSLTSSSADASTVRAGARPLQIDVLLDGVETQRAATGYWGAQSVCWGVTAGAAAFGPIPAAIANLTCTSMVAVCAAQAYVAHRWAGMTFYPGGFFCWKY